MQSLESSRKPFDDHGDAFIKSMLFPDNQKSHGQTNLSPTASYSHLGSSPAKLTGNTSPFSSSLVGDSRSRTMSTGLISGAHSFTIPSTSLLDDTPASPSFSGYAGSITSPVNMPVVNPSLSLSPPAGL
mmetsp:Transcript_15549/g.15681  ORF Transcript_15549/g.15681 Transcript_15549/m.15681 type:complete len:129 (+) Transcript_15549:69-455(+)